MNPQRPPLRSTACDKRYSLDQCALYKVGSKARLATVLCLPKKRLIELAGSPSNYKTYLLKPKEDPFSDKLRKERYVQEPKIDLRRIHERIQRLLQPVELPSYVHGAVKGRSYRTNAVAHRLGGRVATFDIRTFFPSTTKAAVRDFFADRFLCAPDVAELLAQLTTCGGALATGSPLSPLLSYFANQSMFDELDTLARQHGLSFTCYIDDITLSGATFPARLRKEVIRIVRRHGHKVSDEKTRFYSEVMAKHVTGVVLHAGTVRVPHARFRKARAIELAIRVETDLLAKLKLSERLAGLLGEAAYLDPRYRLWAKQSYRDVATLRAVLQDAKPLAVTPALAGVFMQSISSVPDNDVPW